MAVSQMVTTHFLNHLFTHTIPKTDNKKVDVIVGLDARSVRASHASRTESERGAPSQRGVMHASRPTHVLTLSPSLSQMIGHL